MDTSKKNKHSIRLPVPPEYEDLVNDMLRVTVIQATMFFMYYISSATCVDVGGYITLQVFMLLGVAVYWLLFRKVVLVTVPCADDK